MCGLPERNLQLFSSSPVFLLPYQGKARFGLACRPNPGLWLSSLLTNHKLQPVFIHDAAAGDCLSDVAAFRTWQILKTGASKLVWF